VGMYFYNTNHVLADGQRLYGWRVARYSGIRKMYYGGIRAIHAELRHYVLGTILPMNYVYRWNVLPRYQRAREGYITLPSELLFHLKVLDHHL